MSELSQIMQKISELNFTKLQNMSIPDVKSGNEKNYLKIGDKVYIDMFGGKKYVYEIVKIETQNGYMRYYCNNITIVNKLRIKNNWLCDHIVRLQDIERV
jgi:hypothetical protein